MFYGTVQPCYRESGWDFINPIGVWDIEFQPFIIFWFMQPLKYYGTELDQIETFIASVTSNKFSCWF